MALDKCVANCCTFLKADAFSELKNENLRATYYLLPVRDLYYCPEHAAVHVCRDSLEYDDCIMDCNNQCLITQRHTRAISMHPKLLSKQALWVTSKVHEEEEEEAVTSNSTCYNRQNTNENPVSATLFNYEVRHAKQVLAEKYTKYNFKEDIRNTMVARKIYVVPERLNSILQRLYELFMIFKEREEKRNKSDMSACVLNCDVRMQQLKAVLEDEICSTNHFHNSEPGADFRNSASILICADLVCKKSKLMPHSSDFAQTSATSRYDRIIAGKEEYEYGDDSKSQRRHGGHSGSRAHQASHAFCSGGKVRPEKRTPICSGRRGKCRK